MPAVRTTQQPTWHRARPAPLVLVSGPERVLADRAVELIVRVATTPDRDLTVVDAAAYQSGTLLTATSPSLFGDCGMVVIEHAESMNDAFLADALAYLQSPEPDAVVVIRHGGGNRGKRLLDALRKASIPEYTCPAVTRDGDIVEFVTGEFLRAERPVKAATVRALVDAVGSDLAELTAAAAQLMNDVAGSIQATDVARYYGTRVNATAFAVADAAVAGQVDRALSLTRHAISTGTDPVPLIAALASKLRTLAKVGAARGRGLDPTRDLGLAPWMVDRARKDLMHWNADTLAEAIQVVAQADADVKGASRAPEFSLEKAVRRVAELAT